MPLSRTSLRSTSPGTQGAPLAIAIVSALLLACLATTAGARMGTLDQTRAATLLVPYFEVDPDPDEPTITTELVVSNTEFGIICLAHFTLYTDLGIPTINFNALIDPGGTIEIDLHDLFTSGELAFEAFGTACDALSEEMPTTPADLRAAHSGQSSPGLFGGECGATRRGDGIARGFITIDSVDDCTDQTPRDAMYFTTIASEANVMTGHYVIREGKPLRATMIPMVHIEADSAQIGLESFYYRFGPVPSTADGREPLPAAWSATYYTDATDVICWRDSLFSQTVECPLFAVGAGRETFVYDHAGVETEIPVFAGPCAVASSKVRAGTPPFTTAKTGNFVVDVDTSGAILSGTTQPRDQAVVSVVHSLHPGGLSIHVPGTAARDQAPVPVAETAQ